MLLVMLILCFVRVRVRVGVVAFVSCCLYTQRFKLDKRCGIINKLGFVQWIET